MPGGADRVTHVVQGIEGGHQVVPGPGEPVGGGDLEPGAVGDAGRLGPLAGESIEAS